MRTLPQAPQRPNGAGAWQRYTTLEYQLKVVTPIMGGGAEAGQPEKGFAVRPSAIRGHLRFWWRRMYGRAGTTEEVRNSENAIFGSTEAPSKLVIEVIGAPATEMRNEGDGFGFGRSSPEGYAFFPAQANRAQGTPSKPLTKEGFDFSVRLRLPSGATPEQRTQVENAFFAWVYFGGVGARTRRGMGSLEVVSKGNVPKMQEIKNLADVRIMTVASQDALQAWRQSLDVYKGFRQQRRPGQERRRPGRSFWPEPETIRGLRGHQPLPGQRGFPRAVLGLPIVFHFINRERGEDDPGATTLSPVRQDGKEGRMASPVITKAIKIGDTWFAGVIFLRDQADRNIQVQLQDGNNTYNSQQCGSIIRGVPNYPDDDAIQAFKKYLIDRNYSEVLRP
jgi:CRISPR-associated protein Cmr1